MHPISQKAPAMIHIIPEVRRPECDILPLLRYQELRITDLDGNELYVVFPPPSGWTYEALVVKANELHIPGDGGADAYLETIWIGSTKV